MSDLEASEKMNIHLGRVATYAQDMPLLRELGLKPFSIPCGVLHSLGTVKDIAGGTVEVLVTGMPAQFFTFRIETFEGKKITVETGSGALRDYWPAVVQIASGLLTVKESD